MSKSTDKATWMSLNLGRTAEVPERSGTRSWTRTGQRLRPCVDDVACCPKRVMGLENPTCWAEIGETGDVSDAMLGELAARALGQAGNSAEMARRFGARPAIALVFVPAPAVGREPLITQVIAADAATVDVPGQFPPVAWCERFVEVDGKEADDPAEHDFGGHLLKVFVERVEVVREILDHGASPGILALTPFQGRTIVVAGPDRRVGQHDEAIRKAVVFEPACECHAVVGEFCEVGG